MPRTGKTDRSTKGRGELLFPRRDTENGLTAFDPRRGAKRREGAPRTEEGTHKGCPYGDAECLDSSHFEWLSRCVNEI